MLLDNYVAHLVAHPGHFLKSAKCFACGKKGRAKDGVKCEHIIN